ncbi:phosphomannomutase [Methanobacterium sp. CWC-01]|uniref:phosphomannomutase n=1 Tax=Methanobacterium aridiramus TaxID=2584467 RepID=UPI0025760000|nr:phosphomannomutase [Methanobacterium sp. CWC-01]WJI10190.1 phosphomannomutase [Methanobacterium sp. CWC-01]
MSLHVKEIRGVVNSEIVNEFASNLGTFIGNFLGVGTKVVVGRDMGAPSQMIKRSITSGLLAAGVNVIDFGKAPIPAIVYGSQNLYAAQATITITASHLRPEDITIKIFSEYDIPLEQRHVERVRWNEIGNLSYVHDYKAIYTRDLLANIDQEVIRSHVPKLVVECAHGIMTPFTPVILEALGCETIMTGCQSSEEARKFPEPSPESLSMISKLVKVSGSDLGVAIDNDRDRVVFIDEQGNILRDQTALAIFSKNALKETPGGKIVTSVVASMSLDKIVAENGGVLIKTPVDLVLNGVLEEEAVFGGDEPGLYIFPGFNSSFDAIYASLKMLEIICKSGKPLSRLVEEVPEYERHIFSVGCEHAQKIGLIDGLCKFYKNKGQLNMADGFRADMEDSVVLVRPSRFEPLVRVYLEARSPEKLIELQDEINDLIQKYSGLE